MTTPDAGSTTPVNEGIFGKTIALLFGATKVICAPLWASKYVQNKDGTRTLSLFVMVGTRAPLTQTVKLHEIWFDDVSLYKGGDGQQGPATKLDVTFYDGNSEQSAPPEIAADQGDASTPGFRGRICIMIRNYTIAVGAAFPVVSALVEQLSPPGAHYYASSFFDRPNVPTSVLTESNYCAEASIFMVNTADDRLLTFDANSGQLVSQTTLQHASDYPTTGSGPIRTVGALDPYGDTYVIGYGSGYDHTQIRVYDVHGGNLLTSAGADDGTETVIDYFNSIDTTTGTAKTADYWILTGGISGKVQVFKRGLAGGPITLEKTWTTTDTGYGFSDNPHVVRLVDMQNISPYQDVVIGYIANSSRVNQVTQIATGAVQTDLITPRNVQYYYGIVAGLNIVSVGGFFLDKTTSTFVGYDVMRLASVRGVQSCFSVFDLTTQSWAILHSDATAYREYIVGLWTSGDGQLVTVVTQVQFTSGAQNTRVIVFHGIVAAPARYNNDAGQMNNGYYGMPSPRTMLGGANYQATSQLDTPIVDVLVPGGDIDANAVRQVPTGQSTIVYGTAGSSHGFCVLDLSNGAFTEYVGKDYVNRDTAATYTGTDAVGASANGCIIDTASSRIYYRNTLPDYPGYIELQTVTLGNANMSLTTLLTAIGILAGFAQSDIVCVNTDLVMLVGSIVNTPVSFLELVAAICQLFRVDIVETEGKLKFLGPARGSLFATARTLTDADLAPPDQFSNNDGSLLGKERLASAKLPQILAVNYLDSDNGYQVGTQIAKRTVYPYKTTAGLAAADISVPIAMETGTAFYWVTFALFDTWAEALTITGLFTREQLDLEPGDFIRIVTATDGTFVVKITSITVNADWSMSFTASTVAQEAPSVDTINDAGSKPTGRTGDTSTEFNVALVENIAVIAYDTTQEDTLSSVTVLSDRATDVYIYPNDTEYSFAQPGGGAAFGIIQNDHPAQANYEASDDITSITVLLSDNGAAAGLQTNNTQYLAGFSQALIGQTGRWELIYYRDVVPNSDGTLTFKHILRGRRGSDDAMLLQAKGDVFIGLTSETAVSVAYLPTPPAAGMTLPYIGAAKATVSGGAGKLKGVNFAITGGSLKPWSPVAVHAARSGPDIVIAWKRRDRQETDLLNDGDDTATVPLSETTEAYDLEILAPGGTVQRTGSALSTPTYTYTAAQIAADALDVSAAITVRVYQLSSVVGRGHTRKTTCPLT